MAEETIKLHVFRHTRGRPKGPKVFDSEKEFVLRELAKCLRKQRIGYCEALLECVRKRIEHGKLLDENVV